MHKNHFHTFSVAPMMDWTDRHCRAFHRTLSRHALLWSEMVTADAVLHGDRDHLIGFSQGEHPIVLQLGGNDPARMAAAASIGEDYGYDAININCGCPSARVHAGAFGACLMRQPERVADCFRAMQAAVSIPVTVKCRLGVDDDLMPDGLHRFVTILADAGCRTFIIHARKAWLKGLSPKQNRTIPPLDYTLVAGLKAAFPDLTLIVNGGIEGLEACRRHLQTFDGVMLGRAAYTQPALLGHVDQALYDAQALPVSPLQAVNAYRPYIRARLEEGVRLHTMTRHMLGLFNGLPGARLWRRILSEDGTRATAGLPVLDEALSAVSTCAAEPVTIPAVH